MRVAVVGVGSMGRNHARVYKELPEVDLVAVVDENVALAESVAHLYGSRAYRGLAEMVERERPEAVSVVVPTHLHYEVAATLLEMGCHVLVEKPIAASMDEAGRLRLLAARAQRQLMVGHIERYNPAVIELKRRLDLGQLGRVFQMHARRLGPFPARIRDVGVVIDLATHDLDIMRYFTRSEAVRVYAESRREVHTTKEDLFCGTVRFADETLGLLEINWLTPTKIRELYVTGERGMFRVDYITQDLYFFENSETSASEWSAMGVLRGVSEGTMIRFAIQKREPLRAELEAFVASASGSCSTIANAGDGEKALELALTMIECAQTHQVKLLQAVEFSGVSR